MIRTSPDELFQRQIVTPACFTTQIEKTDPLQTMRLATAPLRRMVCSNVSTCMHSVGAPITAPVSSWCPAQRAQSVPAARNRTQSRLVSRSCVPATTEAQGSLHSIMHALALLPWHNGVAAQGLLAQRARFKHVRNSVLKGQPALFQPRQRRRKVGCTPSCVQWCRCRGTMASGSESAVHTCVRKSVPIS